MTTMTRRPASAGGSPAVAPPSHRGGTRFDAWRSSWQVALRLARRDLRRHVGRSLVVLIMVGVPTALLTAGLTIGATSQVKGAEQIPYTMGSGVAYLSRPDTVRPLQSPDPSLYFGEGTTAPTPVPGFGRGAAAGSAVTTGDLDAKAKAIGDLTGRPATWVMEAGGYTTIGDRAVQPLILATPEPERLGERVELVSGRWPRSTREALVTPFGAKNGLPTSGTLTLRPRNDSPSTDAAEVSIVGTARALNPGSPPELVTTGAAGIEPGLTGFVLFGDRPVDWAEVQHLNTYGITVWSRSVLENPPALDPADPNYPSDSTQSTDAQMAVVGGTLLLVMTALLVGPAFAISAARQRRTLALAASQGATTAQLRRHVLAQAIVLGGISAVAGTVAGVIGAWIARWVVRDTSTPFGPFEIPVWGVLAVLAIAVLASLIAAIAPAQRLGRLDIMGVMKGQSAAPAPRRILALLGLVVAGASGAYVLWAAYHPMAYSFLVALPVITLVLGSMLVIPTLLEILGRIGRLLPLPLRLATRDMARHRSRSAPTIAAVLAGTAALTVGLIGSASDNQQQRQEYTPRTTIGEAIAVPSDPSQANDLAASLARNAPTITWVQVSSVTDPLSEPTPSAQSALAVFALPPGCSARETAVLLLDPSGTGQVADEACTRVGTGYTSEGLIAFLPADEIVRRFSLSGRDAETVRSGGAVVLSRPGEADLTADGELTLAAATAIVDSDPEALGPDGAPPPLDPDTVKVASQIALPAVVRPLTRELMGPSLGSSVIVPSEVAAEQKWPTTATSFVGHSATPITDDTTATLQATLADRGWVELEQGYRDPTLLLTAILLGIFAALLLVVTLTSTALSLAEQEQDQATLAAVGADRRTRRLMAGTQTWVLAALGVVLGVVIGFVPGIAIAIPLTIDTVDPLTQASTVGGPVIVIPWVALLIIALVIPAIAGLLAAGLVRRSPDATRRRQ
ncbi:FtsX-like permease family protein [Janibacter sp. GXQ6167]|uniref:FtsX-like permease family protein n=1 Tax=Janibacter sp. GXQ6167 TaxID=3240791 RepID=UPI003523DF53